MRQRAFRAQAILAIALLLASCAGHPKGVMVPVAEARPVPGSSKVDMLVATSRAPSGNPATLFAGERSPRPYLTAVQISIPPETHRKPGEVEWPKRLPPNPATDFAVTKLDQLHTVDDGRAWFKQHIVDGRALVFVHGFNNTYEDSVFRFAQIVHDSGAQATPILFTWPSRARLFDYVYDKESTNYSRTAFENALRTLAADPDVKDITILAHSMGTWLAMESLRQMAIRDGKVNPKINNVILASPDIDIDVFARQFTELGPNHPKFTVFVSQDDRALSASRLISGDVLRLGAIDPSAEPYRSKLEKAGINVFDLTKVKSGDSLNHGKFAESPEIVQLIGQRLVTGQTLTDSDVSVAQGVTAVLAGTAGTVGKVAGAAITAPIAITEMPRTAPPANKANQVDQIFQSGSQPAELTN